MKVIIRQNYWIRVDPCCCPPQHLPCLRHRCATPSVSRDDRDTNVRQLEVEEYTVPSRIHVRMQLAQLERLPPSDLCDALVQITRSVRRWRQAIELCGEDAIAFADAAQKVCILP